MEKRLVPVMLLCGLLAGCPAKVVLPPIAGPARLVLEQDEQRIWNRAVEEEHDLDRSGLIYQDAALEAYLNSVLAKLYPPDLLRALPLRVKVIKNPYLNAMTYANGVVYVHTGILVRMENEAQFAALIGHETVHATHRHALKEQREVRKTLRFNNAILSFFGTRIGSDGIMAAMAGHSRENEAEADTEGLRVMARAGYDPKEAIRLFLRLKEEIEYEKEDVPFFFNTHPNIVDRVSNYENLLNTEFKHVTGGIRNDAVFRQHVRGLVLETVELDLKRGRFIPAERNLIEYIKEGAMEARPYHLLGELYRQRGGAGDGEKAAENYRKAIAQDARFAEAYRALGLLQYKRGEKQAARQNLKTYLSLAPQAPERLYLEEYLREGKE